MGNKRSVRLIAVLLILVMFLGVCPTALLAQALSDVGEHWAKEAINLWTARGIVKGYEDGTFGPDRFITRAEFAALLNRTFGFTTVSPKEFPDVSDTAWYAEEVAKAAGAGYMEGYEDGSFRPDNNITRQEAALVFARIYNLEQIDESYDFSDFDSIPDWSRKAVVAVAKAGLMQGYPDGSFGPARNITRAETVSVLDRLVAEIFTEDGTYGDAGEATVINGNAIITAADVTLVNMHIKGNLLIAESVGDGTVVLDNVVVDGELDVRGGGPASVVLENSKVVSLTVSKDGVRIVIRGSKVDEARVKSASTIEQDPDAEGIEVLIIEEIPAEGEVVLLGDYGNLTVKAVAGKIVVESGHVDEVVVDETATDVELVLGSEASVSNLVLDAPATVTGSGKIEKATVNASGAVIEPEPEEVELGEGVSAIIGGEEVVYVPEEDVPKAPPKPPVVPVSAISIDQEDQLLEKGSTLQLTATVSPANATNKSVTWASSDEKVVTVDNSGIVTAIGKGTATITVTTVDGNKTDTITITVPIVAQDASSLKKAIQEDADDGDTIVLRAGRYELDETLVITKSVKILGPQANIDPRPSTNSPRTEDNNEAVLTGDKGDGSDPASKEEAKEAGWLESIFVIRANDVVINGLTLERTYNHIIYSQTADPTGGDDRAYDITGLQILNNIVRHGRGNEGIKIGRSINALVQYNYIHDIRYGGDAIEAYDVKGFRILDNEIDGCSSENGNIRVSNRAGGEPGIVRGNIIKNTEYHFAINAEDGNGDTIIDNNTIENAKAGGIFVYKNTSISEDTPTVIEITNNRINNYATAPVQGSDYREKYLREAASAIAVSYNLKEGIQPVVTIAGNTTSNGAEGKPVLAFGGGTTDAQAIPTDLSRITVSGNTFDKLAVKFIKVSNENELDLLSDNTWPEIEAQKVYNFTKGSVHDTIQDAINQASPGDTILAGPGTYNESVTIDKSVTLRSAKGAALTKLDGDHSSENYYMVKIKADNVTLDGFTITNPKYNGTADASGIVIGSDGRNSNIRITNCVIHDIGTPDRKDVSFGTFGFNVGPVDGLEIANCHIYNIKNGTAGARAIGIFTWGNSANDTVANVSIHDNIIEEINNPGNSVYGISTGYFGKNITLSNNTIKNVKSGIRVQSYMQGPASVTGNTVQNAAVSGIRLDGEQTQTVTGNTISGCTTGVLLTETCGETVAQISHNTFEDNTVHVQDNRTTASTNYLVGLLENNTFPEGSRVIGNMIMVPEFKDGKAYNITTGVEYDNIQGAIDPENAGHTILVGSGTYEENLVIDKLLVLNGAGRDVTTIKGNISIRTSNVTIEGFTIEGEVVGPSVELLSDIFEKNEFAQESIIVQLQDGTAKITSPSNAKVVNTARNRGYEDFKTAVDAAEPGDTIKLMSDIQLETKIDIAGKTLTLDLNNHKLSTVDVVGDETNKSVFAPSVLNITQNADVTIEGPGTIQSGKTTNSSKSSSNPTIKASNIVNLTIQNCTIIGGEAVNSRYAGDAIEFNSAGTLTLNNVTAAGGDNVKDPNAPKGNYTNQGNAGSAIKRALTENATVNITGSTLKGGDGLNNGYDPNTGLESLANGGAAITNNYASTFNITDSYVKGGNSALYNAGNAITANYGTFTIENCTVEGGDAQTEKAGNGRGIGGDGISVGTSTMTIVSSTITGGDGGDSQLGCGIKYNNTDGILNISDSIISGGGVTGSGTGFGNAIYAGTTESYESFSITLADTLLKLGVDDPARVYGGSVLYKSGTFDLTDMLNAIVGEGLYEILEDGSVRISNPNSPFSINKFSYTVAEEELDLTPLEDAIEAAKAAKEGAAVSEEGLDVPAGAYWVTQEDMDALDEAIARAEAAKETAETQEDVDNAVAELEAAIAAFNEAKREAQEAIDEEELEGAQDPANEQEVEDDEEIVDEQVDTEENTDNGLEGEGEAGDEEDAA